MGPRRKVKLNDAPLVQIAMAQGGRCFYCDQPFSKRRGITRDHLFPRSFGCDLAGNKVAAHAKCNVEKGCRLPTPAEVEKAAAIYEMLGLRLAYRLEPVGTETIYRIKGTHQ